MQAAKLDGEGHAYSFAVAMTHPTLQPTAHTQATRHSGSRQESLGRGIVAQSGETPGLAQPAAEGSTQPSPPRRRRAKTLLGTKPRQGANAQQPPAEAPQPCPSLFCRLARWLKLG